jgi:hypothetical protein
MCGDRKAKFDIGVVTCATPDVGVVCVDIYSLGKMRVGDIGVVCSLGKMRVGDIGVVCSLGNFGIVCMDYILCKEC